MRPIWQKLASLAQKKCTLKFQVFGAFFAPLDTLLRTYWMSREEERRGNKGI